MRIAPIVVILFLLCGVGICAESQLPPQHHQTVSPPRHPNEQSKPAKSINTPSNYSAATRENKPIANCLAANTEKKQEDRFSDFFNVKFTDIIVALFTIIIGIFTWKLSRSTQRLWETTATQARDNLRAIEATEKAANAAKISADAALGVELPRFVVTSMRLEWDGTEPLISITLTNHGRTEALITGECLIYRKEPALAPNPRYPMHTQRRIDFGKIIKTGESHTIKESIPTDDINKDSDIPIIWGYGYIKYRDFLGGKHTSGFVGGASMQDCGRDIYAGRVGVDFEQQGPAAYTYEKYDDSEA